MPLFGLLFWMLAALALAPAARAQQEVAIQSVSADNTAVALKGFWFALPAGGPGAVLASARPAVVLMHGCGGVYNGKGALASRYGDYVALLHAQGMHALVLDSLSARGEKELCTQKTGTRRVTQKERRQDALAALNWLSARPGVDAARLGLLGWSNGGSSVLASINENHAEVRGAPVRAAFAVAFYPGCAADSARGFSTGTRLLMLLGASDDWTPPGPCEQLARQAGGAARPEVVSYPGAFHGFDSTAPLRVRKDVPNGVHPGQGVTVGGNPAAREQSLRKLKEFLTAQAPPSRSP